MNSVNHRIGRILHERSNYFHWSGKGSTSLKSFYNGIAEYRLGSGTRMIGSKRYLLLNDNQPYTIAIDAKQEVESFCVFFAYGFANRVALDMISREDRLLDNPFYSPSAQVEFIDKTYLNDDLVSPKLRRLRKLFSHFRSDPVWLDEQLCDLMNSILLLHTDVISKVSKITASRRSTREELFRRVSIAYEVIMEQFRDALTLGQLSQTAALSSNHLIRSYKQAYGVTPHQHIMTLRKPGI